jgi:hypothetical protein
MGLKIEVFNTCEMSSRDALHRLLDKDGNTIEVTQILTAAAPVGNSTWMGTAHFVTVVYRQQ